MRASSQISPWHFLSRPAHKRLAFQIGRLPFSVGVLWSEFFASVKRIQLPFLKMHSFSFFNFALSPCPLYMTGCVFSNPVYTGMDMMDGRTLSIYIIYSCLSGTRPRFYGLVCPFKDKDTTIILWCCPTRTRPRFYGLVLFLLSSLSFYQTNIF